MTDAEKVELALRRIAADPHAPNWMPYWFNKLADEIFKIGKDPSSAAPKSSVGTREFGL